MDAKIPYGQYAVALYQDLNNNGKLDFGLLGIKPVEPIGFSNNFRPKLSKPTWEDCCFDYDEKNNHIEVKLFKI